MKKTTKKILIVDITSLLLAMVLLLFAWNSKSFSNWYRAHIFPIWVNTLGRVSGVFPFSVGELLLYLAVVLVIIWLVILVMFIFEKIFLKQHKMMHLTTDLFHKYTRMLSLIVSLTSLEMVLNCFILYHADPFTRLYDIDGVGNVTRVDSVNDSLLLDSILKLDEDGGQTATDEPGDSLAFEAFYKQYWEKHINVAVETELTYEQKELIAFRNWIVKNALELSDEMERNEKGYVVYNKDDRKLAIAEMERLGETYPLLAGYYPKAKGFWYSEFFSQQYILGYFFPFTMEANINKLMYSVNRPVTICHELSHLKGFLLEDEANFIGYLACIDSKDSYFRYSAYTSVLSYVEKDYRKLKKVLPEECFDSEEKITKQLAEDTIFLTQEAWEQVEQKKIFPTELVEKASDAFIDGNLKANGVSDGAISYSRVVRLLLRYYQVLEP